MRSSGVIAVDMSDHLLIFRSFCLPIAEIQSTVKKMIRKLPMHKISKLCKDLSAQNWDFITNVTDINEDYNIFSNILLDKISLFTS